MRMARKEKNEALKIAKEFVMNKKVQLAFAIILFLLILFNSTYLRLGNLDKLIDPTSGKYLPSDPDACYELRVAQTLVDRGNIEGVDTMRNPGLNLTFAQEMLPKVLAFSYKTLHFFGSEITLDKVAVLYPVVAFAIGLIIFFGLCWYLSKSKFAAVIASALLAYSPSYLSRNTAGVSSHEALGMPFMFLAILIFVISLSRFHKNWKQTALWGVLSGVGFGLSFFSWIGASNFVLMIMAIGSAIYFLFGIEDKDIDKKLKFLAFTALWVLSSIILMPLFGYSFSAMYGKFLSNYGIVVPLVIALSLVDSLILRYEEKIPFAKSKWRLVYSALITIALGIIGLLLLGKHPLEMLKAVYIQVLFPMGLGRVGLTVAYYQQPYISDLISQYTPVIFWLFVLGMIFIGIEISKAIGSKKHRFGFVLSWAIAIIGMMFSRISSNHLFNGTNFLSQATYIISLLIFASYFVWLYFNDKFKISAINTVLFSWMFVMLLSTRSAIRVIFVIYVFVAFAVAYAIVKLYEYAKESKEQTLKPILYIGSIVAFILVALLLIGNPLKDGSYGNYEIVKYSAANMGPIAGEQWQEMMAWARDETQPEAIFAHWWDYGYQIQLMANRTTILDGGNTNAYWNYMMGRYVLTTPKPETALSFMKTHDVSYLLIDPTDLGKYAAYSKIGSNKEQDRYSSLPQLVEDTKQTTETATGIRKIYIGSTFVDEDISYNGTFLPGPTYNAYELPTYKSYFLGIIMEYSSINKSVELKQPIGVFMYNNKQYQLPIRYVYFEGKIIDFKTGIDSTFRIVPSLIQNANGGVNIDNLGAGIYLSRRVQEGLFARLYLMNDVYEQYPTLTVANSANDYVVKTLKAQGVDLGEIVYFNGLRMPLKTWKVEYPSNIIANEGFRAESGEYGAADSLKVTI
jgi:asparagine N-glycosylation enzyme membrane subunit Stt3